MPRVLVVNPGSTSTKIAVFDDLQPLFVTDIVHDLNELHQFPTIMDQFDFRRQLVIKELEQRNVPLQFDAVVGRGGLARPVKSGSYPVTPTMIAEERACEHQHACDLGCIIAYTIAQEIPDCQAFIADPGTTDELAPEARISGSPLLPRICIWHALNQKAIARRYAREHDTHYENLRLIMCHLGGGISIAAHDHGQAIDANNALDGEGPFSPERAGSLPVAALIRLCFSGTLTEDELLKRVAGHGGLIAHLGSNNMKEIVKRIEEGDDHARLVVDAMIWHVAKTIVSEAAVLCGPPDAIILTGGMAHSDYIVDRLKRRIAWLAPVAVYPGQDEMRALAENALAALEGKRAK